MGTVTLTHDCDIERRGDGSAPSDQGGDFRDCYIQSNNVNGVYDGNFPWLLSVLIVFLCPLIGGYVTARLGQSNGARMGAYSGLVAGLIVLLTSAIVSNLSPSTTLLGVFIAILGVLGGGLGAYLRRGGQQTS